MYSHVDDHKLREESCSRSEKKCLTVGGLSLMVVAILTVSISLNSSYGTISGWKDHDSGSEHGSSCRGDCFARHDLSHWPEAVCNDGSPYAIYYMLNPDSKNWVLELFPGEACSDEESCYIRDKDHPWWTSNTAYLTETLDAAPSGVNTTHYNTHSNLI